MHPGGASCQIEGREDPSRPGKNQGGAGQKGKTLTDSFGKKTTLTPDNRRLVTSAASCRFFVNFIHGEAVKRRENRSLQCLIMCLPGRERRRKKKQKAASGGRERSETMRTQNILFTTSKIQTGGEPRTIQSQVLPVNELSL